MRDVVAFQEGREDSAGTERIGFEGHEDQHGRGERVMGAEELLVEMGDESSREIHGGREGEGMGGSLTLEPTRRNNHRGLFSG